MHTSQKLSPQQTEIQTAQLVNEAVMLMKKQQYQQALDHFNQAIALKSDMALAYFNRGILFHYISKRDAMVADFVRAMQLAPTNFDVFYNAAVFMLREKLYVDAVKVVQRAVELNPDHAGAWLVMISANYELNNDELVRKLLAHARQKFPHDLALRVRDAFFLPPIAFSRDEIAQSRTRLCEQLRQLMQEGYRSADPLKEPYHVLFSLAYHGVPHKEISELLARFFLSAYPKLDYTAPHCTKPRKQAGEKIRLGFVSPSMHKETLNQFLLKIIEKMSQDDAFDIVVFSNAPALHPEVQKLKKQLPHYVDLPMDIEKAQQAIAKEEMDALLYMEVGSDPLMYMLPFARLAPIQSVWGGLPVTTGIPNMDYFISSQDGEVEGAQAHYTEKLVLLDRTLAVYSPPKIPDEDPPREALGLPTGDVRLYTCPVLLHKLHPDMDEVFRAILARDSKAQIILFDPKTTLAQNVLMKRFSATIPAQHLSRINFLPFMQKMDFPLMLRAVDCVLDTFHYSFGTTAYISFAAGVPFVTKPTDYYSSRAGDRMYKRMNIPEMIAKNSDDYIDIALKLAQDKNFYNETKSKIIERRNQFFDDYAIVDEFADRMKQLYFDGE